MMGHESSISVEKKPVLHQIPNSSVNAERDQLDHPITSDNFAYDNVDKEPELHLRTYVALAAVVLLGYVQVLALQSPPAVLSYIAKSLGNTEAQTWVPNVLSLVQAVVGPAYASASDTFQARKTIIFGASVIAFVGAAIAPGSTSIYRLIAAQAIIGLGYASTPLSYAVPSEILPRKWRPGAQALINMAAALASISGPLLMGGLTRADPENGWRKFYWIQMAIWGVVAIGLFFGYRPPKRHTRYDHLTIGQKIKTLDLLGSAMLTVGLTLILTGLNLGGGLYSWTDVRTLTTLIIGFVGCVTFAIYEWKGSSTGILHHDLFRNGKVNARTFAICCLLFAVEALLVFAFVIFYPVLTQVLFEDDPLLLVSRSMPYWIAALISTGFWGYLSIKMRNIKIPMLIGFMIYTVGTVGFATIQPGQSLNALAFAAVSGVGFGAPLVLIITGVQLSTPHRFIATATAIAASSRALAAAVFTAIYSAALNSRLSTYLPKYIAKAALGAGLPPSSLATFVPAIISGDTATLPTIPGVSPIIIGAGVEALKQAYADGIRIVFIIASAFAAAACIATCFITDMKEEMTYRVDAPVENLHVVRGTNASD